MTLDEKKSGIIEVFKQELAKLDIRIDGRDLRTSLSRNKWSIWIEQKDGLNTKDEAFIVDLDELNEGVNYGVAVPYLVRRWSYLLKSQKPDTSMGGAAVARDLPPILIAEDDEDDRIFINKALKANLVKNPIVSVSDGEQLLDYLYRRGKFADLNDALQPCLILLDLNMPRVDGRNALKIIKKDPNLRKIPIVILTTSMAPEDIVNGYENGVNSFITKPVNLDGFVKYLMVLQEYWLNIVQLPPRANVFS